MKNKELTLRIKSLLHRKGFSQEELAEKAGLSLQYILKIIDSKSDSKQIKIIKQ